MDSIQQVLGEYDYSASGSIEALMLSLMVGVYLLIKHIYMALTLYSTAKKLSHPRPWLAWIPIANLYLQLDMGDMSPYFLLVYLSPIILYVLFLALFNVLTPFLPYIAESYFSIFNFLMFVISVVNIFTFTKISKKRGYDKLLGLLMITQFTAPILRAILAWGKRSSVN